MNRKRTILFLFVFLMVCNVFLCVPAQAATRQGRKLVSVVLDDSTSMNDGNRWKSTQYAMQVLSALLNPDDELIVHFLSEDTSNKNKNEPITANLSTSGSLQNFMETIAKRKTVGNTPFGPVQKAYKELVSKSHSGQYDQYWLFVMTDGAFTEGVANANALRDTFEQYVDTPVGSDGEHNIRLVYLRIGNDSKSFVIDKKPEQATRLEQEGIYCYQASNKNVVETMGQIADTISGRTRFTGANNLTKLNANTLQISSEIPLFNFVVLSQGTNARLQKATYNNTALSISRTADVVPTCGIRGSVYWADQGASNIPAGTYQLEFDQAIDPKQVIVLFEPALEVRLFQKVDGKALSASDRPDKLLYVGQSYSVYAGIYEAGTNQSIGQNQLPVGTTLVTTIRNGETVRSEDSFNAETTISSVSKDRITVDGVLSIPGFNPISNRISFDPNPTPLWETGVMDGKGGMQNNALTARVEELNRREKYFDFKVNYSGQPANNIKEGLDSGDLVIASGGLPYDEEFPEPGILRIYPRYNSSVVLNQPYQFTLSSRGGAVRQAQATVTVVPSEYIIQVAGDKEKSIKEAAFRFQPQTFAFELTVDGKPADPNDFEAPTFTVQGNAVRADKNGKQYIVTVPYTPEMAKGVYKIEGMFHESKAVATLQYDPSVYGIEFSPKERTIKEAAFRSQPQTFTFELTADGNPANPDDYEKPVFTVQGNEINAERKDKQYIVTVEYTPEMAKGTYQIKCNFRGAEAIANLHYNPSEYKVDFSPKEQKVKETEFRDKSRIIKYTLKIDNQNAEEADYNDLSFAFAESGTTLPGLKNNGDPKNRQLELSYRSGMSLDQYTVVAKYKGAELDQTSVLKVEKARYEIRIPKDKVSLSLRQSELATNEKCFEISLNEDGRPIDVEQVSVDTGKWPAANLIKTKGTGSNADKLYLKPVGDLTSAAGEYPITLSYQAANGTTESKTVTLIVEPSVYQIDADPDNVMVFGSVDEMAKNDKPFVFNLLVDDRPLLSEEMKLVTNLEVSDSTKATVTQDESRYTVLPVCAPDWKPESNQIDFTVSCTAGNLTEQRFFKYNFVVYSVECFDGEGQRIQSDLLKENTLGLSFRIMGNNVPLQRDMVEGNFTVSVASPFNGLVQTALKTSVDHDGTVHVVPTDHSIWPLSYFANALRSDGDMVISLQYKNASGSGTLIITPAPITKWLPVIIFLLAVTWILLILFKKRFKYKNRVYYCTCDLRGKNITARRAWKKGRSVCTRPGNILSWLWALLAPKLREVTHVQSLKIRGTNCILSPGRGDSIEVYVGKKARIWSVNQNLPISPTAVPNISCPSASSLLQPGWNTLTLDNTIVVHVRDGVYKLYQYSAK